MVNLEIVVDIVIFSENFVTFAVVNCGRGYGKSFSCFVVALYE